MIPVVVIPAAPLLGISALAIAPLLIESIPMHTPHTDCALYSKQQYYFREQRTFWCRCASKDTSTSFSDAQMHSRQVNELCLGSN